MIDQEPPYSARAVEHSDCLFIPRDRFEILLDRHPKIARRWLSSCTARVATTQMRILELLALSPRQKVARLLLDEAADGQILLPQRTLAAMVAMRRQTLNRALREFERRGLVKIGYSEVTIIDGAALEEIATTP